MADRIVGTEGSMAPGTILLGSLFITGYVAWRGNFGGMLATFWWILLGVGLLGVIYVAVGFGEAHRSGGFGSAVNWLLDR